MLKHWIGLVAFIFSAMLTAHAAEFPRSAIPDPLKSWVPWVLDSVPDATCPHQFNDVNTRQCAWGGTLELKAGANGATFAQDWVVYQDTWLILPGDEQQWPQELSVDGKASAVLSRDGLPALKLGVGSHKLSGRFYWSALPESMALPLTAGILRLELNGRQVNLPVRDESNRLWLQRRTDTEGEEQAQVRVFRKVIDGIPLQVETRLRLEVSGKSRELVLGRALLAGMIPKQLSAMLPVTLEADGSLKVQARAGVWDIQLLARYPGTVPTLNLPPATAPTAATSAALLATEEVWVFEAAPLLRSASVIGPEAVDPQQTSLPPEWRSLPAFLMRSDSSFGLKEIRRGDSEPAPDKLALERQLWMSFDGSVISISDRLHGDISRASRLNMGGLAQLGRVDIAGQDQLITRGSDNLAGVEVKRGRLIMSADSVLTNVGHRLPALGWQHDVDQLSMALSLPAGWRLLHAGGADHAQGAWISAWNLLDFFVVLVIALAVGQLWGRKWGALALLLLILTYQEVDAPRYLWIILLATVALMRALPAGRFKEGMLWAQRLSFFILLMTSLVFATAQLRGALYPVLEYGTNMNFAQRAAPAAPVAAPVAAAIEVAAAPEVSISEDKSMADEEGEQGKRDASVRLAGSLALKSKVYEIPPPPPKLSAPLAKYQPYQSIDPNAKVQTGPGLPDWSWNTYSLTWDGPVRQDQQLDLWLLSPWMNKLVVLLRLLCLGLLLWCVAEIGKRKGAPDTPDAGSASTPAQPAAGGFKSAHLIPSIAVFAPALAVALIALASGHAQAQSPSTEQLDELREKLTRPADCLPECVDISRLSLQLSGTSLRLSLEVDAAIDSALPLPGGAKHWLPHEARVDGKIAYVQKDAQGGLWLLAAAGKHRVELIGELSNRDTLQLPLPRKPRRVDINADGWDVAGISDDNGAADTLQLSRRVKAGSIGEAQPLPPLLRVQRRLVLDLLWRVETTVQRDSPLGVPALVEIPLLPGEAVTSAGVIVKDGKVLVNLGPQATSLSWSSTLAQAPELSLTAIPNTAWVESWVIAASTMWHVAANGIAPVAMAAGGDADLAFYPWPGEVLKLRIERPQAIVGQTLTIDHSRLLVTPGARASDYLFALSLRSSRGGDHSISLPPGAVLQSVSINGQVRPIRANGRQLILPILPGKQELEVRWRLDQGMALSYATASVDLNIASVNSRLSLQMPHDRWLLLSSGPGVGPAILFWGKLLVLLAVAVVLGRVSRQSGVPMQTRHWILLVLGLTQVQWWAASIVIVWFFAFAMRGKSGRSGLATTSATWLFNWRQVALLLLSLAMLGVLLEAVRGGLLGYPDMQVAGNNSSYDKLNWYLDRSGKELQGAWVLSLPIMLYRALMLAWALWLAWSLLAWLKWGWSAYSSDGLWRHKPKKLVPVADAAGVKAQVPSESVPIQDQAD
ncbi:hypothetical protein [Undibacterium sp. Ren11W]|uniref:hypothetical protein n=1 Tax=Undibacterium sp. Ren11W TaxID=3413045 RepID=UPI003BF42941